MGTCLIPVPGGITGGGFGAEQQFLALAGWLAWLIAGDCMGELGWLVEEEAATGTLEQLCITPFSLLRLLVVRGVAYFLGTAAQYVVIAGVLLFFVRPAWPGPAALPVLLASWVGVYGLGFAFAGLALVFKHMGAVLNLASSLMIFTSGALIGLEKLGAFFDVLRLVFPNDGGEAVGDFPAAEHVVGPGAFSRGVSRPGASLGGLPGVGAGRLPVGLPPGAGERDAGALLMSGCGGWSWESRWRWPGYCCCPACYW